MDKNGRIGGSLPNPIQYDGNAIDNNIHPLFLHNNDHLGLVLISKKLIGPDNYAPWSRSMRIALNARKKFVHVNGLYKKCDVTFPLCAQLKNVNDMIITWMLNSVADEISDGLNYVTIASQVWTDLYERFYGVNRHKLFQI